MVVRRDFGSYRRADANGDSRAARVQYRLGRAAAVLARTVQYECHQRARVSFGRHVGGHGRAVSGVLRPGHRDSAGHVLLRRAAQPLPDREFHPISQPADPQFCVAVLLLHEPMRAQGYAAFMVIWVAIAVYSFGSARVFAHFGLRPSPWR